jgi:hypothetical protein
MSRTHLPNGPEARIPAALEASAGLALACAYSSSDEYEAEVIQVRRKAGAYGSQNSRPVVVGFVMAAAAIVIVLLVV